MSTNVGQTTSDGVGWPSAVVAVGLLLMVSAISVAAIVMYRVDDALKIWTALTAVVGVITGAFVSYFFTRGTVQQMKEETARVQHRATLNEAALKRVAGRMTPEAWRDTVAADPVVAQAVAVP